MSITYNEIKEQYKALRKTFDYMAENKNKITDFYKANNPKSLIYTGCGSSYCLSQSGEFSTNVRLDIPATAIPSGDLMLNYKSYEKIFDGTLLISLSRSGSTSEAIKAINNVKSVSDIKILTICCVEGSELSKISDLTIEIPWAFDASVCQTRSVTNIYMANLLLIAYLSEDKALELSINQAIESGEDFINRYEEKLKAIAQEEWSKILVLADGEMQGIASEAVMAINEIAEVSGNYYHVLDVRHGPMVLVNKDTLAIICLNSEGFAYQKDLVNDIIKKGASVITYSDTQLEHIDGVKLHVSSGLKLDNAVRGIPFINISQLLAYYKALEKGTNPDAPQGLDAWIKL